MKKNILILLIIVASFLGGFSGFLYFQNFAEVRKMEVSLKAVPPGAENVIDLGDCWLTFDWNGNHFIMHREINYWAGTAVESLAIFNKKDDFFKSTETDTIPIKTKKSTKGE